MIGPNTGGYGYSSNPFIQNNQNVGFSNQYGGQVMNQPTYNSYDSNQNQFGFQNNMTYNTGMQQQDIYNTNIQNQQSFPIQNTFNQSENQQQTYYNTNFDMNSNIQNVNTVQMNTMNSGMGSTTQFQQVQQTTQVIDQNSEPSSLYTDFDALPHWADGVNVPQVVDQIKIFFEDKANWKSNFDAIDNLRILNKYYPKEINDIAGNFWKYITASFESQKTNILKNILLFTKEVFTHTATEVRLHDDLISGLIPIIIKNNNSEKKLIKTETDIIIQQFVTNCCFDSSIIVLCKSSFDKNAAISEIAFTTLVKMVLNIGENLPKLGFNALQALMITLAKILDTAKKGEMKENARQLCKNFMNMFGLENYYDLIKSTMAENQDLAPFLVKAVEKKEDAKDPKRQSDFHQFVQGQKQKVRMTQYGGQINNGMNPYGQQKMTPQTVLGEQMNSNGFYNNNNMNTNFQMNNTNMGGYNGFPINFPQNY